MYDLDFLPIFFMTQVSKSWRSYRLLDCLRVCVHVQKTLTLAITIELMDLEL